VSDLQVHLNGRLVLAERATVSVFDSGFLHGGTAFTTMLAKNGVVFRLARHIERLMGTVELLGFRCEASPESLTAAVYDVLSANELTDARVRITLSPGSTKGGEPTVLATAEPLPDYPAEWYERGIPVVVSSYKQAVGDPTFGHKTGCYFPRVLARHEAAAKGAEEALWFTHDNHLAEACFCNVFLVAGGIVRTPPRDTPVLGGIVRQAVLELCDRDGIPADAETPLTVKDMLAAEEAFVTASTMGIRPVVRFERHEVGAGSPGEVTRKLMAAYRDLLETECSETVPPKGGTK